MNFLDSLTRDSIIRRSASRDFSRRGDVIQRALRNVFTRRGLLRDSKLSFKEGLFSFLRKRLVKKISTNYVFETGVKVDTNNLTALQLQKQVEVLGKIPFSQYMQKCLYGDSGYYSAGKVNFGQEGDFLTSPECSEFFGATIANFAKKMWEEMGKPEKFDVVEMGCGSGKCAYDFLSWTKEKEPAFFQVLRYKLVEASPELIKRQKKQLESFTNLGKTKWLQGSAYELSLQKIEGLIFSNELPDAFPVERVVRLDGKILQKYVAIRNGKWVEILDTPSDAVMNYIKKYGIKLQEGVEEPLNLHAACFQELVCKSLKKGGILTIDYGWEGEVGGAKDMLPVRFYKAGKTEKQRISGGDPHYLYDLYKNPGALDMTADVNFAPLAFVASKHNLEVNFSGTQKTFLIQSGLEKIVKPFVKAALKIMKTEKTESKSYLKAQKTVNEVYNLESYGEFFVQLLTTRELKKKNVLDNKSKAWTYNRLLTKIEKVSEVITNYSRLTFIRRFFAQRNRSFFIRRRQENINRSISVRRSEDTRAISRLNRCRNTAIRMRSRANNTRMRSKNS